MTSERVSQSLAKALQDLLDERAHLDEAIAQLQGFLGQIGGNSTTGRGRGRARKQAGAAHPTVRRRWTAAGRRAAAERMRKYWADRKKTNGAKAKKTTKQATSSRSKAWSPTARKAAAERMRKYWADRRKGAEAHA
jgi:hypothetical protein